MDVLIYALVTLLWQPVCGVDVHRIRKHGDVIIGGLLPLHVRTSDDKCGSFFRYGLDYVEAMTYAINKINGDDQILPNITLGYDIRDFCDSSTLAMKEAYDIATSNNLRKLAEDYYSTPENVTKACRNRSYFLKDDLFWPPIAAIVGPVDSSSSLVVANLLEVVQIPAISPFATSEELSTGLTSFFRTVPSDRQQAKAMADVIDHFGWEYIAVVAVDHSYGRYGMRALERESFARKTFCIALTEFIPQFGYEEKIKTIIMNLKRKPNIRVIVLWSTYTPGQRVLKEAARLGLHGRTWVISEGITMQGPAFIDEDEAAVVDGFIGIVHPDFGDDDFKRHLRAKELETELYSDPSNPWWDEYWDLRRQNDHGARAQQPPRVAHYGGHGIGSPLVTLGNKKDHAHSNTHISYTAYLIDAIYAIAHALDKIYRCTNETTLLKQGCPKTTPAIDPKELGQYIRNVAFDGLTERVSFNDNGDPLSSSYDVINFQPASNTHARGKYAKIGDWREGRVKRLLINESLVRWKRNATDKVPVSVCRAPCPPGTKQTKRVACCWGCNACQEGSVTSTPGSHNCTACPRLQKSNADRTRCVDLPVTNIRWSNASGIVYAILSNTGILAVIWVTGVFIKYRKTPVVKSSNRELSFVLLFSISILFLFTQVYIHIPSDTICMIIQPGRYLVYTLCVSILLVKTNRIVRLFALGSFAGWFKRISIEAKSQIVLLTFLNGIQIAFAIMWLTFDPPRQKVNVQPGNHMWYTCNYFDTRTCTVLEGTMFIYLCFLLVFCTFYAFKARKLPENYNETRYIGFAMYILIISWMTFYPIKTSIDGTYLVHIACTTTLVSAYGMLACLFFPKLYIILLHSEKNTMEFVKAALVDYSIKSASKVSLATSKASISSTSKK